MGTRTYGSQEHGRRSGQGRRQDRNERTGAGVGGRCGSQEGRGRQHRDSGRDGRDFGRLWGRADGRAGRRDERNADRDGGRADRHAARGTGREDVCAGMDSVHELFPLTAVTQENFALLHAALTAVLPLRKSHRQELAANITALSRLLTVDRAELRSPYWARPALTSAYVHYFLPWNVYRLSRLLAGLQLPEPEDGHFVLDVGSGPLTMPIALWLSQPAWRSRKLHLVAADCAGHPLHLGRDILQHLAREAGLEPWDIHLVQAPFVQALRSCQPMFRKGLKPVLVTAANVLNELPFPRRSRLEEDDDEDEQLYSRFEDVLAATARLLRRGPEQARALFVEPGTRLGGLTLMRLRDMALEQGLEIHGPCTHQGPCPLMQETEFAGETSRLAGRTWCHATFPPLQVPDWLAEITAEAGFARQSLSLAWLEVGAEPGAGMPFFLEDLDDDLPADSDDDMWSAEAAPGKETLADGADAPDAPDTADAADGEDGAAAGQGESAATADETAGTEAADQTADENDAEGAEDAEAAGSVAGAADPSRTGIAARVISNVFSVPGLGACRYACSPLGLLLLAGADQLADGASMMLHVEDIQSARVDRRSGARILVLPAAPGLGKAQQGRGSGRMGGPRERERGRDYARASFSRRDGADGTSSYDRYGRPGRQERSGRPDRPDRSDEQGRGGRGGVSGHAAGRRFDRPDRHRDQSHGQRTHGREQHEAYGRGGAGRSSRRSSS